MSSMTAALINGNQLAISIIDDLKLWVQEEIASAHRIPGLAVILLGDDAPSTIYVNRKRQVCQDIGFHSFAYDLPETTREDALIYLIETLNHREDVDGILVQLPLPTHVNAENIIESIHPNKDVDGFHPYNLGRLAQGHPRLRPCTPYGIIQLLAYYKISLPGKNVVIVGASNIVGRPMALEFLLAKATVTICHQDTLNLEAHIRHADIVVVAVGVYEAVKTEWFQQGQIVIDVGIHRKADGIIHGDLNLEEVRKKVAFMTPVPGGVGPMTLATLLQNTKQAYQFNCLNHPN